MVIVSTNTRYANQPLINGKENKQIFFAQTLPVSFGRNTSGDRFTSCSYEVLDKNDKLFTPEVNQRLQRFIQDFKNNRLSKHLLFRELGTGYQGKVFLIPDLNITVKLSHTEKKKGIPVDLNCNFENESNILKQMPLKGTHNQKLVARLKIDDGLYALITTRVKGIPLDSMHITKQQLNSLLNEMFVLDKARIMHCDLRDNNIMTNDNQVGIIDFGSSFIFDQFVEPYNIKYGDDFYQHPAFWPPSNVRFFDFHTILPTYFERTKSDGKEKALGFFIDYLKLRSDYHSKRADLFYEEMSKGIDNNKLTTEQCKQLKESIKYERLQAKIFRNPSKKMAELEISKIFMDYLDHKSLCASFDGLQIKALAFKKQTLDAAKQFRDNINTLLLQEDLNNNEKMFLAFQKRFVDFYEYDVITPKYKEDFIKKFGNVLYDNEVLKNSIQLLYLQSSAEDSYLIQNQKVA
ncbi:MAG: hypothetical protein AB1782_09870 [Cyanobacteriota bacterium]